MVGHTPSKSVCFGRIVVVWIVVVVVGLVQYLLRENWKRYCYAWVPCSVCFGLVIVCKRQWVQKGDSSTGPDSSPWIHLRPSRTIGLVVTHIDCWSGLFGFGLFFPPPQMAQVWLKGSLSPSGFKLPRRLSLLVLLLLSLMRLLLLLFGSKMLDKES